MLRKFICFSALCLVALSGCNKADSSADKPKPSESASAEANAPAADAPSQAANAEPADDKPTANETADDKPTANETADDKPTANETADDKPALNANFIVGEADVTIPEFAIRVTFSEKAYKKLADIKEFVTVAAYFTVRYSGEAPKSYKAYLNEIGEFNVTDIRLDFDPTNPSESLVVFKNVTYPKKIFDVLREEDLNLELLINIFSARKTYPNNILDCDILQDRMSALGGKEHTLACKLIEE